MRKGAWHPVQQASTVLCRGPEMLVPGTVPISSVLQGLTWCQRQQWPSCQSSACLLALQSCCVHCFSQALRSWSHSFMRKRAVRTCGTSGGYNRKARTSYMQARDLVACSVSTGVLATIHQITMLLSVPVPRTAANTATVDTFPSKQICASSLVRSDDRVWAACLEEARE